MIQIAFPALVAALGLIGYALASNPKVVEMGRIAFFCGLFFVVWVLAGSRVHF